MTRHLTTIALLAIASAALAQHGEATEHVCPQVDEGPAIDAAPEPPTFYRLGIGGDEAPAQTRIRFVMDEEALYERFVVTNDLGFEPEGTVDFLVEPSEG